VNGNHETAAARLILAKLNDDQHAVGIVATEIGDCANSWRVIAELLAQYTAEEMEGSYGLKGAISWAEFHVARFLDRVLGPPPELGSKPPEIEL
jgi:hypothetical protein